MNNDFTTMTPEQRRGKRWLIQIVRIREVAEFRYVAVEAESAELVAAAARASQERLSEPDEWALGREDVTAFDIEDNPEEYEGKADYRIGEDGKLEEVE